MAYRTAERLARGGPPAWGWGERRGDLVSRLALAGRSPPPRGERGEPDDCAGVARAAGAGLLDRPPAGRRGSCDGPLLEGGPGPAAARGAGGGGPGCRSLRRQRRDRAAALAPPAGNERQRPA